MSREVISSGNALAAKAAIDCGCEFFGGYPITPSSEIAHDLSVSLPKIGGKFIQMEDEHACEFNIERLMGKINNKIEDIVEYEEHILDDAEACIIAFGSIYRGAKEAVMKLRSEGIKAGLFRPITLWPSPAKKLKEIGERFEKIFVTELNIGQYLEEIQRVMKRDDFKTLHKANGRPVPPLEMVAKVKEMF